MQPHYVHNNQGKLVFLGGTFLTTGITFLLTWPWLMKFIIDQGIAVKPGSFGYKMWHKNPMPLYLDFYLFNWTNPHEIHNLSTKPTFREVGPIRFEEVKEKVNVTFNSNDTVSFRHLRTWRYMPEESAVSIDTEITTLNAVTASGAYTARHWSFFMKKGYQFTLSQTAPMLHVTKRAGEFLFDGYEDFFVSMGNRLSSFIQMGPKMDKFGWFYTRNFSETYDGYFNMDTTPDNLGELRQWNYVNKTRYYKDQCGKVHGSAGELFPKNVNRTRISFFSPDICRNIVLDYETDEDVNGVNGYKFVGSSGFLDNGTEIPENLCYNTGENVPSGAINASECRYGSPGFVSLPHFHRADPYYLRAMEGLQPNKDNHEFFIILEPTTGIPLSVAARLQLNLLLRPVQYLTTFEKVPTIFFPVLWFEQRVIIPDNLTFLLRLLLQVPLILQLCGFLSIVSGIIVLSYVIYKPAVQLMHQRAKLQNKNVCLKSEAIPLQDQRVPDELVTRKTKGETYLLL